MSYVLNPRIILIRILGWGPAWQIWRWGLGGSGPLAGCKVYPLDAVTQHPLHKGIHLLVGVRGVRPAHRPPDHPALHLDVVKSVELKTIVTSKYIFPIAKYFSPPWTVTGARGRDTGPGPHQLMTGLTDTDSLIYFMWTLGWQYGTFGHLDHLSEMLLMLIIKWYPKDSSDAFLHRG